MRQWFSFKALISSRLAYKEFENCPALGTKREIAAMWSPVFHQCNFELCHYVERNLLLSKYIISANQIIYSILRCIELTKPLK